MKTKPEQSKAVSSNEYTKEYYQHACQGHMEFKNSGGLDLPNRLKIPLDLAQIQPGMKIIDIGCGRGEIIIQSAKLGAYSLGIDYATEAINISKETIGNTINDNPALKIDVFQCDATSLPFLNNSFDRIFMLDVVEHLYPQQLDKTFQEIYRVLKPAGKLIIHTMPNIWYYKFGYPLYRFLQNIRGVTLPANPRERFPFHHLHVNEHSPLQLLQELRAYQFRSKILLRTTVNYSYEKNPFIRWGMDGLTKIFPVNYVFCNDIFAIAEKPHGG
jgi:ubiquinone/menaquinone biosynthesis C-methylase UbiE